MASHPERLQYIYFNTVLLLRAVSRLGPYLSAYDYCAQGTHEEDVETLEKVAKVVTMASDLGKFDETVMFRGENANVSHASQLFVNENNNNNNQCALVSFDRFSKKSSKNTSAMFRVLWTASVATNADFGAKSKRLVWALL